MNMTNVAARLDLLQARDTIASTIGTSSTRINHNTYSAGIGILGNMGFLRGRIINLKKAIAGDTSLKPDPKAKLLARAQEHKRTMVQQAMFELNASTKEFNNETAVLKALQKELDSAEARLRSFDKDNPELANLSESELQTLCDEQQAGNEPTLTTDNPQVRMATEAANQQEHDSTVEQFLSS